MAEGAKKKSGGKPDLATIGGLILAIGGILGGLVMEGGKVKDVAQVTAAIIVLAGTIGAVMVTTPMGTLIGAVKKLGLVFFAPEESPAAIIEEIIGYAAKARKSGIVSLENDANAIQDPFLRKALNLAVDGTDLDVIRKTMELQISLDEHHAEAEAKVFESAGGYAPTIGIIGAVLGLIQVMKNLANIEEVGTRHCGSVRSDGLRRWHCQFVFSTGRQQDQSPHAEGHANPGIDAGRRGWHCGRAQSQTDSQQTRSLHAPRTQQEGR